MYRKIIFPHVHEKKQFGHALVRCFEKFDKIFDTSPYKSFAVYSDYSGKTNGDYNVYSFLFTPIDTTGVYYHKVEQARKYYGLERGEISFKKMGHNERMLKVANEALRASNNSLPGILVNVCIDKSVNSLFTDQQRNSKKYLNRILLDGGFKSIPKNSIETALRISHIFSFLSTTFLSKEHLIFWMSDNEDDFYPKSNEKIRKEFIQLLDRVLPLYTKEGFEFLNFCVQGSVDAKWHRELVSLVDMSAAGINDILTLNKKEKELPKKSELVGKWLSLPTGLSLQKFNLLITRNKTDVLSGSISLDYNGDRSNMVEIPITQI
ncbi:hypothetical protein [Enterovibrio baiacu]|uniref:hypothetical protein n=1 Tax=Enterovibrio baiacu TaxID=2491023 RepID=UPI0010136A03|nr:hypothetical protein [Enterovibrio baiacu]MBE1275668.1 hypothetical protein [Enterovibrio baiacu]